MSHPVRTIGQDAIHALRERQRLIHETQPRHDDWKDEVLWIALGLVATACLLAW